MEKLPFSWKKGKAEIWLEMGKEPTMLGFVGRDKDSGLDLKSGDKPGRGFR